MQIEITDDYLSSQGFSATFQERFWTKVTKNESCWIWTAYRRPSGYGEIQRGVRGFGAILAHRASFILNVGPIPDGLEVLHDCPGGDNPACVNPDHLWLGTQADNCMDMIEKGRAKLNFDFGKGESHPRHKLSQKDVDEIRLSNEPQRIIAARFNIWQSHVGRIKRRENWKD